MERTAFGITYSCCCVEIIWGKYCWVFLCNCIYPQATMAFLASTMLWPRIKDQKYYKFETSSSRCHEAASKSMHSTDIVECSSYDIHFHIHRQLQRKVSINDLTFKILHTKCSWNGKTIVMLIIILWKDTNFNNEMTSVLYLLWAFCTDILLQHGETTCTKKLLPLKTK